MKSRLMLPLLALLAAACSASNAPTVARIGEACASADDCASSLCRHGLCTRLCAIQGDCPTGFDCTLADPADVVGTCRAATWSSPASGGFGTGCGAAAGGCGGANPCADGFECRADIYCSDQTHCAPIACDAKAYCTQGCASDAECPPTMFCGQERKADGRKCLKRTSCEPCGADDQCPSGHLCTALESGERVCAKSCAVSGDCLKPTKDTQTGKFAGAPFEVCGDDSLGRGKVCLPAGGACHAEEGAGKVCDACRLGHPGDCAAGHVCYALESGERFCTKGCSAKLAKTTQGYDIVEDDCGAGAACFFGGQVPGNCGESCSVDGLCTADTTYQNATCHPLR
jgi:hypothetical protein